MGTSAPEQEQPEQEQEQQEQEQQEQQEQEQTERQRRPQSAPHGPRERGNLGTGRRRLGHVAVRGGEVRDHGQEGRRREAQQHLAGQGRRGAAAAQGITCNLFLFVLNFERFLLLSSS